MHNKILKIAEWKLGLINKISPVMPLIIRLWLAKIFWVSGVLKLPAGFLGIGRGNWNSTLYLFTHEYSVPILSPQAAALTSTFFEILCPILLVLGLGTRSAAFILLIMTAFIELTYQHASDHIHWMLLCGVLIFYGAGRFSADYFIRKRYLPDE